MQKLKRSLSIVVALVLALSLAVPATLAAKPVGTAAEDYFADYAAAEKFIKDTYGDVADDMIKGLKQVADLGILQGSDDAGKLNINADKPLSRLEYVTMLYNLTNSTPIEKSIYNSTSAFTDVRGIYEWGRGYANWAYIEQVSTGISKDGPLFGPDLPMNYYDAMLMILSLLGVDKDFEMGVDGEKVLAVSNEIRHVFTMKLAEMEEFNLIRDIEIQNPAQINRAEAFNLMYYALGAKYVKYNATAKAKSEFTELQSVFEKNHKGVTLEGYISATKYANLGGDAVKDGYVAVLRSSTKDAQDNIVPVYHQIDEAAAAQIGLKLEGFDNLRNLGDEYKIMARAPKDSNGNVYLNNIVSCSKKSTAAEYTNDVTVSKHDEMKSATGNDDVKEVKASNYDNGITVYKNFGATATSINDYSTGDLGNEAAHYTKLVMKDNKVLRVIKSDALHYQRIEKVLDNGKYKLVVGKDSTGGTVTGEFSTSQILGFDSSIAINWTVAATMAVGDNAFIYYPTATEGTASTLSADYKQLTVDGTKYRTFYGTDATDTAGFDSNYVRASNDAETAKILGKKTNYYFMDFLGQNYVLGFKAVDVVTTGDIPTVYAVVLASSFYSYVPGLSDIREEKLAEAYVSLQLPDGSVKSYKLDSVYQNNTAKGKTDAEGEKKVADDKKGATFSGNINGITYKGFTGTPYANGSINGKPFAYKANASTGSVSLYEIPTLATANVAASISEPVKDSKFNIAPNVNKTIESRTHLFVPTKSDNGSFAAFVGSGISNIPGGSETFTAYYANTTLAGEFNPTGSYSRLVSLYRTDSGTGSTKLFVEGAAKSFFTLSAPTLIAGGKATQTVLTSDGVVETITANPASVITGGPNKAGYYVEYELNSAGEAIGRRSFGDVKTDPAFAEGDTVYNLGVTGWHQTWSSDDRGPAGWDLGGGALASEIKNAKYLAVHFNKAIDADLALQLNSSKGNKATAFAGITTGTQVAIIDLSAFPEWADFAADEGGWHQFGLVIASGTAETLVGANPSLKVTTAYLTNSEAIADLISDDEVPQMYATATSLSVQIAEAGDKIKVGSSFFDDAFSKLSAKDDIYLSSVGISDAKSPGLEYLFANNPSIFLIEKNLSSGEKIDTAAFAALDRGSHNFVIHLNSVGKIDKVFAFKK